MSYDFDLFVVGAGSAGVRAARMSAGFGAKVAIAENRYLGGTCVNVGCVPKKLFVYAAHYSEDFADAKSYGWASTLPGFDWPTLRANKDAEITHLNEVYGRLLADAGVTVVEGRAHLADAHSVTVGEDRYTSEHILIATGGWPNLPRFPGREFVISSNEVFHMKQFPRRVIVVGGGYIAVEFAGIFNALGADTVQLYRGSMFLRGFDMELRSFLAAEMTKKGIDIKFDSNIKEVTRSNNGLEATLIDGSVLHADTVLFATGRKPNTAGLGLETAGVALNDKGAVIVDSNYRSSVAGIFAIGDVTDRINLTPVATAEGSVLARNLFGNENVRMDYNNIPTCVFSQPNLGTVGLTEEQARETLDAVDVYRSIFTPLKHTISKRDEKILMKLIVDKKTDRVVGVHMIGPDAGEIIQGIAIAMKAGATKAQFDATVGIHPTAAEEFVTMRQPG